MIPLTPALSPSDRGKGVFAHYFVLDLAVHSSAFTLHPSLLVPHTNKNVLALAVCQGLLITNNITVISLGSLAGYSLAAEKSLATLPATGYVVGSALSTYGLSLFMKRHGRRAGFTLGALAGMLGAVVCTTAVAVQSFWLFCLGTLVAGVYPASGGYYRFAAADVSQEGFKSRAISLVLAGGIIGGVLGPESSKITKDLLSITFMYMILAALILFSSVLVVIALRIPTPQPRSDWAEAGRCARSSRNRYSSSPAWLR